jgi:hypothetical protein
MASLLLLDNRPVEPLVSQFLLLTTSVGYPIFYPVWSIAALHQHWYAAPSHRVCATTVGYMLFPVLSIAAVHQHWYAAPSQWLCTTTVGYPIFYPVG